MFNLEARLKDTTIRTQQRTRRLNNNSSQWCTNTHTHSHIQTYSLMHNTNKHAQPRPWTMEHINKSICLLVTTKKQTHASNAVMSPGERESERARENTNNKTRSRKKSTP
ncbi:MAG: hypothetical protein BYD32DRAFT_148330 [Podila humilis]|nr:MAG: hypothetical protein BYD32DRAFT_148330 [Podila humilis]